MMCLLLDYCTMNFETHPQVQIESHSLLIRYVSLTTFLFLSATDIQATEHCHLYGAAILE